MADRCDRALRPSETNKQGKSIHVTILFFCATISSSWSPFQNSKRLKTNRNIAFVPKSTLRLPHGLSKNQILSGRLHDQEGKFRRQTQLHIERQC